MIYTSLVYIYAHNVFVIDDYCNYIFVIIVINDIIVIIVIIVVVIIIVYRSIWAPMFLWCVWIAQGNDDHLQADAADTRQELQMILSDFSCWTWRCYIIKLDYQRIQRLAEVKSI